LNTEGRGGGDIARETPLFHTGLCAELQFLCAAVPIPKGFAAEGQEIEEAIGRALKEAEEEKLSGAKTTPFLLQRIQQLTGGKSLAANIHLIKNNAKVGAQIACALAQMS